MTQLQTKYSDLEGNYKQLETMHKELQEKHTAAAAIATSPSNASSRTDSPLKGRVSVGASDPEKQIIGYRQMIDDMSAENTELQQVVEDMGSQLKMFEDDNKQLTETNKQIQNVSWGHYVETDKSDRLMTRYHLTGDPSTAIGAGRKTQWDRSWRGIWGRKSCQGAYCCTCMMLSTRSKRLTETL